MSVDDFAESCHRAYQMVASRPLRREHVRHRLAEVVGHRVEERAKENVLGHALAPQCHARPAGLLRDAFQGDALPSGLREHRDGGIEKSRIERRVSHVTNGSG